MATTVRVPNFLPSVNGLRFINSFPQEPAIAVHSALGTIPIGDASNGLCGGMVFTTRDVFQTAGMAPLTIDGPPGPDTPLYHYLVQRLVDSFDLGHAGFMKYYDWMITPDGDTSWAFFTRRGLAWKTIQDEFPGIKRELNAGRTVALGLITTNSPDPTHIGLNHQVLAYGYDLDGTELTVWVYDPNTPSSSADGVKISLDTANPTQPTHITHNVGVNEPIRGFFKVGYKYDDPTALAG